MNKSLLCEEKLLPWIIISGKKEKIYVDDAEYLSHLSKTDLKTQSKYELQCLHWDLSELRNSKFLDLQQILQVNDLIEELINFCQKIYGIWKQ